MKQTYYKVVTRDGDKLYSAWVKSQGLKRCVKEYKIGRKTKGLGTKLFIFDNFSNAKMWGNGSVDSNIEIYECEVTGVEKAPIYIPAIVDFMKIKDSVSFWKFMHQWWKKRTKESLKKCLKSDEFQTAPDGTLVANSVTLTRKVL